MKIQSIILCLVLTASVAHAAERIQMAKTYKPTKTHRIGEDDQVRAGMHSLMESANKNISALNIEAAQKDIEQLRLLADKTQDKALALEINQHANNLEGSLRFNMKHRHGEISIRKR